MKDIRYGRETMSRHQPIFNKAMALDWIKHIDEWHSKDPYAQKEKELMI